MSRLTVGSLFSGIGGIDLGLERAGMKVVWQIENDEWCNRILAKHWPDIPRYGDITTINPNELEPVDVIAGGFPCQPVSLAGARKAQEDVRWLWPAYFRIVRHLRPRYVVVENVPGLASAGMGDVLGDLAAIGYDAEWESIPASAVGAPHLRYRIFIVAYPNKQQLESNPHAVGWPSATQLLADTACDLRGASGHERPISPNRRGATVAHADPNGRSGVFRPARRRQPTNSSQERGTTSEPGWWAVEPDVGRVANGIPRRVDRLRGLGNAVVPQVAEYVGRLIVGSVR